MLTLTLALFPLSTLAALNGRCTGAPAAGIYQNDGICIHTATCRSNGGTYISGGCPYDVEDVKCCIIEGCAPSGRYSWCDWTSDVCNGRYLTGLLPSFL
jgi:hypothetical protein